MADDNYGFRFPYDDGDLGYSEYLDESDIEAIGAGKGNNHRLYIFCEECEIYMDYHYDSDTDEDRWVCSRCGASVDGYLPYQQLNHENDEYLTDIYDDDYDEDFELYRKCHPDD